MSDINPSQITFARVRRRWSKAQLAKELGVSSRSIQNYETGASTPEPETLAKIAKLLNFPQQFFFLEETMPTVGEHAASFRKLSKMTEAMKNCALSAGAIGYKINQWIESRFNLPEANLPDLSDLSPEVAAATLRRMWGLGNAPIPNMVHLLESKGVRVFSLAEEVREVDAFCVWYEGKPFIFLNTMKSAERSRFDAAHELGHLVRDVYSMQHGESRGPEMEHEANAFAAAFLMPEASVIAHKPPVYTLKYLIEYKHFWGVSLVALAYRYNTLKQITEWTYRNLCIEMARNGYRTNEPEPMERESSQLLSKVLDFLHLKKMGRKHIADNLSMNVDQINALTFKLTRLSVVSSENIISGEGQSEAPKLRLV